MCPRVRLPPAYTSIHSYPSFIYVIYISAHDTRLARPSWSMLLITERHGTSKTPARVFLPSEKEAIVTRTLGARKSDFLQPRLPAGRRACVKRSATPNDLSEDGGKPVGANGGDLLPPPPNRSLAPADERPPLGLLFEKCIFRK